MLMSKILVRKNLNLESRIINLSKSSIRRLIRFVEIIDSSNMNIRRKLDFLKCSKMFFWNNIYFKEDYDILVLGSGDGMEDEMVDEGPVKGPFLVIIIVGSVLLFILLCLVVPCIIECRKCRREGKNRPYNIGHS